MADLPIIFSGPMIKALLDGRKSQTRRILKPQPMLNSAGLWVIEHGQGNWSQIRAEDVQDDFVFRKALPYAVGDHLWVREAFCLLSENPNSEVCWLATGDGVAYRATDDDEMSIPPRWRPSIHMPRWASRLTLTVTDLRVQRLQDIHPADCLAEGWPGAEAAGNRGGYRWFMDLWNSLHGPDAWDANPWVSALTFTVQRGNIDELGEQAILRAEEAGE